MKPEEAETLGVFVADMIHAGSNEERKALIEGLRQQFEGKPGSGVCICDQSPEVLRRTCVERWFEPFETTRASIILDHRCPKHGEKAQPKLWGRHKELKLTVRPQEWLSLGVEYPS